MACKTKKTSAGCGTTKTGGFKEIWAIPSQYLPKSSFTKDTLNRIQTIEPTDDQLFCKIDIKLNGSFALTVGAKTDGQGRFDNNNITVIIDDNDENRNWVANNKGLPLSFIVREMDDTFDGIGFDGRGLMLDPSTDNQGATLANGGMLTLNFIADTTTMTSKTRILVGDDTERVAVRQELTEAYILALIGTCSNDTPPIMTPTITISSVSAPAFVVGTPSAQTVTFNIAKTGFTTTEGVSIIALAGLQTGKLVFDTVYTKDAIKVANLRYTGVAGLVAGNVTFNATAIIDGSTITSNTVTVPITI